METYEIFKDLAIVLLAAKFFAILSRKIKVPMVVGEIIAGLIIGPCLLGWVQQTEFLSSMAEIGVVLIMFSAGLETNLKELKKSGLLAFFIACMGVLVPLVGGTIMYMAFYGFAPWGDEEFFKAMFVGCIMTATSVGITVEALKEMGYLKGRIGQTIVSAAIIDDVIGIVLTFVIALKDPNTKPVMIVRNTALFFLIAFVGGYLFYRLFQKVDAKYPHSRRIPIIGVGLCFALAYCAERFFGIADITGAYVAGIILCNIRDAEYIDRKVSVVGYMFFGPIFFIGIGLKTDLSGMTLQIIGCGLVAKIAGLKNIDCLKIGVGMMTRGEVALIISQKGMSLGIIDASFFTAVILLIITSSILVPILLKALYAKSPDPKITETA